jgi:hypothetical protein
MGAVAVPNSFMDSLRGGKVIKTFTIVGRTGQVSNATNVERGLAYDFFRVVSKPHIKRRHSQIQIALIKIGEQLGFRTWIAQNDKFMLMKI